MALLPKYNSDVKLLPHRPLRKANAARRLPKKREITGYAQVADFISSDKELAVYRRFDRTAARLLLVLQSEIILKQEQLDELDEQDAKDADEKRFLAASTIYEELSERREARDDEKHKLLAELRTSLKEYYELLTAQSEVLKLSSPADRVKNVLTGWLEQEQCLVGLGETAYFEEHKDLVALRPAKGEDRLSQFMRDHCGNWMKKRREPNRRHEGVYYLPESRIAKAVGFVSVLMAGLLLVGAIISLYSISRPSARLGLITMWTILFAFSVSVLSTARRSEIFAATAAYAAVLVVFVSGNLASPNQTSGH